MDYIEELRARAMASMPHKKNKQQHQHQHQQLQSQVSSDPLPENKLKHISKPCRNAEKHCSSTPCHVVCTNCTSHGTDKRQAIQRLLPLSEAVSAELWASVVKLFSLSQDGHGVRLTEHFG